MSSMCPYSSVPYHVRLPCKAQHRLTRSLLSIVAVPGIAVHPMRTWVHRKTKVNWLMDETMLPAAVPRARIAVFGYKSYWFGDDAVKQSLHGVAGQLLCALDDKRKDCRHRPIIFIGHCFGGLVVQCVS
jgi:hypothetical protein